MFEKPNFLIIMSDQHAADTIGGMRHPVVQTPALDQLMATGISFPKAYCCYPMCTPSRASFMTGHLAPNHGVWELGTPLRSDLPTWAHVLRHAGYCTSISGRMHFVGKDKMHGFQRRVHPDIVEMLTPFAYGDWDEPQSDDHLMVPAIKSAGPTKEPTKAEQFDKTVSEAAIEEMSFLASNQSNRPWALMVGLYLPHFEYAISQSYYDRYDRVDIPLPRVPPNGHTYEDLIPPQLQDNRKWLGLTSDGVSEDEVRTARRCYYAMITHMDELIGNLLCHLQQIGAADNTWVVYLSDHGDNMGEHGFWSKLNFYEDSVRIPFVISPPAYANPGAQCQAPVSMVDWMSTVLDLTGEELAFDDLPGRSLVPLIENPALQWPERPVFSDYACNGTRVPMRMIRRGRWKACFAPGLPPLLFDLDSDPYEWNDLSTDNSFQHILKELHGLACSSGWDAESLRDDILQHKRRLKYIHQAESKQPAGPMI